MRLVLIRLTGYRVLVIFEAKLFYFGKGEFTWR